MATWIDNLLDGMRAFFISTTDVTDLIGDRLYEVASESWIVARQSVQEEQSPRLGRWVSYAVFGGPNVRTLTRMSGFRKLSVALSFYAMYPRDARQVFDAFYEALGTLGSASENNYAGTWGEGTSEVDVQAVRFDLESLSQDYDEVFRQAVWNTTLLITAPAVS